MEDFLAMTNWVINGTAVATAATGDSGWFPVESAQGLNIFRVATSLGSATLTTVIRLSPVPWTTPATVKSPNDFYEEFTLETTGGKAGKFLTPPSAADRPFCQARILSTVGTADVTALYVGVICNAAG